MKNPEKELTLTRAIEWAMLALIALLTCKHIIDSLLVLTLWGPEHPGILYSGGYLISLMLLLGRIGFSLAIVVSAGSGFEKSTALAVLPLALLSLEGAIVFVAPLLWMSQDPQGIQPILENSSMSGFLLAGASISFMLHKRFRRGAFIHKK